MIDSSKGYGRIDQEGGGSIRFQESDVADGFEFSVLGLRGKRVSFEPRLREHPQAKWRRHAANVRVI